MLLAVLASTAVVFFLAAARLLVYFEAEAKHRELDRPAALPISERDRSRWEATGLVASGFGQAGAAGVIAEPAASQGSVGQKTAYSEYAGEEAPQVSVVSEETPVEVQA